jgi:RNA polymerase sigma-70 factor, ECF subfamily
MRRNESCSMLSLADLAALGKLFEEHRPRLLAMLKRRIDPALAVRLDPEELLNEAVFLAQSKWAWFKEQQSLTPYAWLYGTARDCLIEAWRRHSRGVRDLRRDLPWPEESSIQLLHGLVNTGTSPSAALARAELRQDVRNVLSMLKDKDREILGMRHFDELSFAEAAEVLGISENAATVRYVRALRRLKDLWQQLHPDHGVDP